MYGLVLEGGGAKGAYQVGAYFALKEMGYSFKSVVGTSIGAINGAFIVMGEIGKCAQMWSSLTMQDFLKDNENEVEQYEEVKYQEFSDYLEAAKGKVADFVKQKQIPLTPLKELIEKNIDEEKIRKSDIDFGLVTVNLTDKKGEKLFLKDIPKGALKKYLIATAYFPTFKLEALDGKFYLDGGFYDNIPFDMILSQGLKPVIIRTNPNTIKDKFPENALIIAPKEKYASPMDFDPQKAHEIMRIGYFDAYKEVKGLLGEKYYIKKFTEDEAYKAIEELFFNKLDSLNIKNYRNNSKFRILFEEIIPNIASEFGLNSKFTYVDFIVKLIEKEAQDCKIDYLRVYTLEELIREINFKNINISSGKVAKLNEFMKKVKDKNNGRN